MGLVPKLLFGNVVSGFGFVLLTGAAVVDVLTETLSVPTEAVFPCVAAEITVPEATAEAEVPFKAAAAAAAVRFLFNLSPAFSVTNDIDI